MPSRPPAPGGKGKRVQPLFAAEDWHVALAVVVAGMVGGVVGALGRGAGWLLNWYAKRRGDEAARKAADEATTLEEWQKVVRWQSQLIEAQTDLLEQYRHWYVVGQRNVVYLHGLACQFCETLRQSGMSPPEVKPLEEFLPPDDFDARVRQVAQSASLVKAQASKVAPQATQPPGPSAGN